MMNMKWFQLLAIFFSFSLCFPLLVQGSEASGDMRAKLLKQLKLRKQGYEKRLNEKEKRKQRRKSHINKHKKVRYEREFAKRKARENFTRSGNKFSRKAYYKFVEQRNKKNRELRKIRNSYRFSKKTIRKILRNNKYKIDKAKEYKL